MKILDEVAKRFSSSSLGPEAVSCAACPFHSSILPTHFVLNLGERVGSGENGLQKDLYHDQLKA